MKKVSALILAAGTSSRMKQPKQLLPWQGKPLLEYQINKLSTFPFSEIIVVLGYEADKILKNNSIDLSRTSVVICNKYHEGLSSSLIAGFMYAEKKCDALLVMPVDLPLIQSKTIHQVYQTGVEKLITENEPFVIQSEYKNQCAHPVFIGHFQQLDWKKLSGDQGAKPLIKEIEKHETIITNDIGVVFDIDTPEAYEEAKAFEAAMKYKGKLPDY